MHLNFKGYTVQITILHPARVTRWLFKTRAKCSIGNFFHGDFEIAILSQFCTEINILSQKLTQNCSKNCDNIARKSVRQFRQFRQFRHVEQFRQFRQFKQFRHVEQFRQLEQFRQFRHVEQFRQFRQFRQFSWHAPKLTYYRKTKRTIAIKIAIISQGVVQYK